MFGPLPLQVNATLDEQAFSESWGMMAKQVFTQELLDSLPDPKDKKLMKEVTLLGAANLPQNERQEVCFPVAWFLSPYHCYASESH